MQLAVVPTFLNVQPPVHKRWKERKIMELLRFSTLIQEYSCSIFKQYKNEFVMFAWSYKKDNDLFIKYWSNLNAARFLAYMDEQSTRKDAETTSSLTVQIYKSLMTAFNPEVKELVHSALDAIVPLLLVRLQADKFHKIMRFTKKITNEESSHLAHLVHVWRVIVRYSEIFYPYRHHFITLMLQNINRLGLQSSSSSSSGSTTPEYRKMACGIAQVIVAWEKRRVSNLERKSSFRATMASAITTKGKGKSTSTGTGTTTASTDLEQEQEREQDNAKFEKLESRESILVRGKGKGKGKDKDKFTDNAADNTDNTDANKKRKYSAAEIKKETEKEKEKEKEEKNQNQNQNQSKDQLQDSTDGAKMQAATDKEDEFTLNPQFLQILVSFLVRFCLGVDKDEYNSANVSRYICLFQELSKLFSLQNVSVPHYDKILSAVLQEHQAAISAAVAAQNTVSGPDGIQKHQSTKALVMLEQTLLNHLDILVASMEMGLSRLVSGVRFCLYRCLDGYCWHLMSCGVVHKKALVFFYHILQYLWHTI